MTIRIAVMSAVLAAGSIAFSQTTSSAPASAPAVVADLGELAELPGALNLDDKAVALLREKLAQKKDALTKFMKEVGPAWSKAMSDATADDAKQAAEATAVLKKCQAQWDTFGAEQDAKVFSILTPEQRLAWDQHSLYRAMVRQFSHTQRMRRWAMTARNDEATRNGLTPISCKRAMALGASLVCSVLKTR